MSVMFFINFIELPYIELLVGLLGANDFEGKY